MQQIFRCILIDRYVTPAMLSPAEFSSKIRKFLQSLAAVIISLTHMLPASLLALTLYKCTLSTLMFYAFIVLNSNYFGHIPIYFKLI